MCRFLLSIVACAAVLVGCEENLASPDGTERAFSLYGVLTPRSDTQWVHVFPIEGTLTPSAPEMLDVEFISTDLRTGETLTWRDSLIQDATGYYGHVFWAPLRADYGRSYRIFVRSESRGESSVEVAVPGLVTPRKGEPTIAGGVKLPLHLDGDAPGLLGVKAAYSVRYAPTVGNSGPNWVYAAYEIPQDDQLFETSSGWRLSVDLNADYGVVHADVATFVHPSMIERYGIQLLLIRFEMLVASEDWNPPGGQFDSLLMIQPEVMTNVENGFGFVGAGYTLRESWQPTDEVVNASGFQAFE